MMPWLILLVSLVGVALSADLVVGGARSIARRLGVPVLIVGLTVTSIGTSLPEIFTNLAAGWTSAGGEDASGLAVGNIIGSNFTQISLLLGLAGLVSRLRLERKALIRDGGGLLVALLAMWLVCVDGVATPVEGGVLVLLYVVYLVVVVVTRGTNEEPPEDHGEGSKARKVGIELLKVLGGLLLLVVSADQLVKNGVIIAEGYGISELVIGYLVGVGTSVPELTVALRAVQKGEHGLSIGNLLGSNITDPLLSFGLGAMVFPVVVEPIALTLDFPFWLVTSVIVVLFLSSHDDLDRQESWALLLLFGLYTWLRVVVVGVSSGATLA